METKLHISLATQKVLMLNFFIAIIKKKKTTFDAKPIICVSSTNKGKTQARWVVVVG